MALHSTTVIARASGSEAELCLYTVNDDDGVDVINHDVALQSSFEIRIWNVNLALNSAF